MNLENFLKNTKKFQLTEARKLYKDEDGNVRVQKHHGIDKEDAKIFDPLNSGPVLAKGAKRKEVADGNIGRPEKDVAKETVDYLQGKTLSSKRSDSADTWPLMTQIKNALKEYVKVRVVEGEDGETELAFDGLTEKGEDLSFEQMKKVFNHMLSKFEVLDDDRIKEYMKKNKTKKQPEIYKEITATATPNSMARQLVDFMNDKYKAYVVFGRAANYASETGKGVLDIGKGVSSSKKAVIDGLVKRTRSISRQDVAKILDNEFFSYDDAEGKSPGRRIYDVSQERDAEDAVAIRRDAGEEHIFKERKKIADKIWNYYFSSGQAESVSRLETAIAAMKPTNKTTPVEVVVNLAKADPISAKESLERLRANMASKKENTPDKISSLERLKAGLQQKIEEPSMASTEKQSAANDSIERLKKMQLKKLDTPKRQEIAKILFGKGYTIANTYGDIKQNEDGSIVAFHKGRKVPFKIYIDDEGKPVVERE